MSHARCNLAARTTPAKLKEAAFAAMKHVSASSQPSQSFETFDAALDFLQPLIEDLGGKVGSDAWYMHQVKDWAVLGDLTVLLHRSPEALAALSAQLPGELVVCVFDPNFDFAYFASYIGGQMKRQLTLEDGEYEARGLPVAAERGRPMVDFSAEESERIWMSYGLPTFEYNPEDGPFECIALDRIE